jgi:hypothetical protein
MDLVETNFSRWADFYVGLAIIAALTAAGYVALKCVLK